MLTRRQFLVGTALGGAALATGLPRIIPPVFAEDLPAGTDLGSSLAKYVQKLTFPPVLTGNSHSIDMTVATHSFHPDLPDTTVYGYNGITPGPTIAARRGTPIEITVRNLLGDQHFLPVDTTLHGAIDQHPTATVHLHGGNISQADDGYPEAEFLLSNGDQYVYRYPNGQRAATLWYHDHSLGKTRLNVIMGLAGFYILQDENGGDGGVPGLRLPTGKYEVPLAIQDRSFLLQPSSHYGYIPAKGERHRDLPAGSFYYPVEWEEEFAGQTAVINGKVWPYHEVEKKIYRLRVLNGSNTRRYKLSFEGGFPFWVIGTEGGLLARPERVKKLTVTPGERYDLLVDFSLASGSRCRLLNAASAPRQEEDPLLEINELMEFRFVGTAEGEGATIDEIPAVLSDLPAPEVPADPIVRTFVLKQAPDPHHPEIIHWRVFHDDDPADDGLWPTIIRGPRVNRPEVWRIINASTAVHPMHTHFTMFRVLERRRVELQIDEETEMVVGYTVTDRLRRPQPGDSGEKDTVRVEDGEMVTLLLDFKAHLPIPADETEWLFPFHCHVIEHEDHEMMRQYALRLNDTV